MRAADRAETVARNSRMVPAIHLPPTAGIERIGGERIGHRVTSETALVAR